VLGLWEEISKLPNGIETELTDFGAPMTYTQLQRLMLARAMLGQPHLLVIDGLLDHLAQDELDQVLTLLKRQQHHWMLIVTTRYGHIARQCQQVITLGNATEDGIVAGGQHA
jgi:ABC-type bacteriocin/lantibiotic exporter with double-glycine peptidase domain